MIYYRKTLFGRGPKLTAVHDDKDGNPIFEGTGDLRNDFDELIYLIPSTNPDGSITISTRKDKTRADIRDESFLITLDREVKRLDRHVDTLALNVNIKILYSILTDREC